MTSTIGIPIKVLHEAEGHIVTVETMLGEVYRGKLLEAEDNMNVQMEACTVTYRNGQTSKLENVFIRGSKIRFLILPDMLKNAPMFKNMNSRGGRGGGFGGSRGFADSGKSAILRAQAARGRGRGGGGRGGGRGFGDSRGGGGGYGGGGGGGGGGGRY